MEKTIQKLIDKLGKKDFDTEKKVSAIDMQVAFENGFTTEEVGGILALQKAIKTHSVYSFLMGGTDAKPEKKEAKKNDHERDTGIGESFGYGS